MQLDIFENSREVILRATERAATAARAVFGREAEAWLAPSWVELAAAIRGSSFDPRCEVLHAAPMLLRAGKWEQACACLHVIASWRRQPAPLAWKIAATADRRPGSALAASCGGGLRESAGTLREASAVPARARAPGTSR